MTQHPDGATEMPPATLAPLLIPVAMMLSPLWLGVPLLWARWQYDIHQDLQSSVLVLLGFAVTVLLGMAWLTIVLWQDHKAFALRLARVTALFRNTNRTLFRGMVAVMALPLLLLVISGTWDRLTSSPPPPTGTAQAVPASARATVHASARGQPFLMDHAGLLEAAQAAAINKRLADHQARSGHTLVVYIAPQLGGLSIETFARNRFDEWGIGRAGVDDGILVVVAPRERQMRIELGRGMASLEPEAKALVGQMGHAFARGDYYGGIDGCVDTLIARTSAQ
ncbi:MAG: TPM domain-containing protein [Luteimonas sp.]|nr:TPM domain-containing protein [Luteimonas sp.]